MRGIGTSVPKLALSFLCAPDRFRTSNSKLVDREILCIISKLKKPTVNKNFEERQKTKKKGEGGIEVQSPTLYLDGMNNLILCRRKNQP